MLNGAEIDVAMSFDPADLEAIADWHLTDSVQVYVPASDSNSIESFVTMTFDAAHQAGAKGVADALRDRAVQVCMQDITVLGRRRSWTPRGRTRRRAAFATPPTARARLALADPGTVLPEPRPGSMTCLTTVEQGCYAR